MVTAAGMKWLDILEKEFDKAFTDLDVIIGHFEEDSNEHHFFDARQRMGDIASIFLQLAHKASIVFEANTGLEKEQSQLREKLIEVETEKKMAEKQLESKIIQLNTIAETYHSKRKPDQRVMPLSLPNRTSNGLTDGQEFELIHAQQEIKHLRQENVSLRKNLLNLESELLGAKLKSRYLDKELSGRIQQIQLLSKPDLRSFDQDRVWNQLEAEIHLHRHKTVVRACRDQSPSCSGSLKDSPPGHEYELLKKRQGVGDLRDVVIERKPEEGLGISITGGKEHGIPVLISEIHPNTPASRCGCLYVGDAIISVNGIDLRGVRHEEAAEIVSKQQGSVISLQVFFVTPDEDSDDEDEPDSQIHFLAPEIVSQIDEEKGEGQDTGSAGSEGDALSSVTDTIPVSPNKFYPGVAQLCTENLGPETPRVPSSALKSYSSCATNSRKETLID